MNFERSLEVQKIVSVIRLSVGKRVDRHELIKEKVTQGDTLSSLGIKFEIIEVPGHTLDHIAFYSEENNILFCGDTLFAGGCGRVFEGTFDQMFESLNKLKKLPNITQIYCGHEYTKNNLQFSIEVESENNDLIKRNTEIDNLLLENGSSLPSTIELEKKTNPFLRCNVLSDNMKLIQKIGLSNPSEKEIFKYIREWKDST